MRTKLFAFFLTGSVLLMTGCYYDKFNELHPGSFVDTCDPSIEVTYTNIVRHIMSQNCLSCHSSTTKKGDVILETYDQVKAYADKGDLIGVLESQQGYKAMPPTTALRSCDIDQIKTWINNGTPQ